MRTPILTFALVLLCTGSTLADACNTCTAPIVPPAGPTTVNNGGNSNAANSTSNAAPVNTSNTVANPQSQALSSNVNTQVNTVNNASYAIGNGSANCGGSALALGVADTRIGGQSNLGGYNAVTGFASLVMPLGQSNMRNCRDYQRVILAHGYVENCSFFMKSFPNIDPAKIDGFQACAPLYTAPVVAMLPVVAPVPVPQVVTLTKLRVFDSGKFAPRPNRCTPDASQNADLALLHARRGELRAKYQDAGLIAAHDRLTRACVDSAVILHTLDG